MHNAIHVADSSNSSSSWNEIPSLEKPRYIQPAGAEWPWPPETQTSEMRCGLFGALFAAMCSFRRFETWVKLLANSPTPRNYSRTVLELLRINNLELAWNHHHLGSQRIPIESEAPNHNLLHRHCHRSCWHLSSFCCRIHCSAFGSCSRLRWSSRIRGGGIRSRAFNGWLHRSSWIGLCFGLLILWGLTTRSLGQCKVNWDTCESTPKQMQGWEFRQNGTYILGNYPHPVL